MLNQKGGPTKRQRIARIHHPSGIFALLGVKQICGVRDGFIDVMERIGLKDEAARLAVVEIGKGRVDMFDTVNRPIERSENIAHHGKAIDEVPKPVGFDDDKVEPSRNIIRGEHIAGDRQATKGKLVVECRITFMLIRPFDEVIVTIVASENAFGIGQCDDNPPPCAHH